jgi:hypothetical protein
MSDLTSIVQENTEIFLEGIEVLQPTNSEEIKLFVLENQEIFEAFVSLVLSIYVSVAFSNRKEKIQSQKQELYDLMEVFPILKRCLPVYSELLDLQALNPRLTKEEAEFKQQEISALFSYRYN